MATFLPGESISMLATDPPYRKPLLINTDEIRFLSPMPGEDPRCEAWLKNGQAAVVDFPFKKLQDDIRAQLERNSARGQVIREILGIWDETLKLHPELTEEHHIAVEWITRTFTGSELGI